MAEKNINKIIIGEDTYNLRDSSVPAWAKEENKPTYTAEEVGARSSTWLPTASQISAVPTSRTINGKALISNITLSASDVNTYTKTEIDNKIANLGGANIVYIPNESLMPDIIDDNTLYVIGEEDIVEEDLLSFRIAAVTLNTTDYEKTFYYRDGMTWSEWFGSDLCTEKDAFSLDTEASGVMVAAADPEGYVYYWGRPLMNHDRTAHVGYMEHIQPNNQNDNYYVAYIDGGTGD